ncbi:probable ubiquitin-conjugating enzyme E2 12 [Scaptodrosophila lebanonensis]|uniref:Probable ubiquitin-conjugating enzyme E2 12 n=1 Tax=Drosophila lebanonensis TaxID=7225 RepID=A0A6J2TRE6_DROLE|nr:probable ubiquitin-conjugating enzyme E2 12 [Scaptodrosophila lebanonensis]XP_030378086.1 probable ubiquitin-conjugating enzyme E2 12 [Scaptodrosophila lebanonensis]XP_030378087.1 probable ubiquitin-conjugating enzyme E2 12 [Scaptodrosophila lebanonensis]
MLGDLPFVDLADRGDGVFRMAPALDLDDDGIPLRAPAVQLLEIHEPNLRINPNHEGGNQRGGPHAAGRREERQRRENENRLLHMRLFPNQNSGSINSNAGGSNGSSTNDGSYAMWKNFKMEDDDEPGGRLAAAGKNAIPAVRRLIKELHLMETDPPENTWARPKSMNNLLKWRAKIRGPEGSPYENGVFEISLTFPEAYPFEPPIVRFTTPLYHCNVNGLGYICVDVLNERACWSPGLTIDKLLLSLSSMLNDADPNTAFNAEAASVYMNDRASYDNIARAWTRRHAMDKEWET